MLPELPCTLVHFGRVVVDAVGDGLFGGLRDGPQVAEVGPKGHVRVTGGEVEHLRLAVELTGRGESGGAARREPRWYGEASNDARGGAAPRRGGAGCGRRRRQSASRGGIRVAHGSECGFGVYPSSHSGRRVAHGGEQRRRLRRG